MGRESKESVKSVWRERIARQRRGQLSVAQFCSQEGVSTKSFYTWRQRLRAADAAVRSSLFVPVELPIHSDSGGGVRLELPSGMVVTLSANSSPKLVTAAIRAAMSGLSIKERASC